MSSPKKINKMFFLYVLYVCTIGNILILAAGIALGVIMPNLPMPNMYVCILIVQDVLLLALPIVLFIYRYKADIYEIMPVRGLSVWNIIYIVMTAFLMMPVMEVIATVTSYFAPDTTAEVTAEILSTPLPVGLIIMALGPAVMEEVLFRGIIFGTLKKFGTKKAIILSAFYFGIYHMNPYQIPYAFFAGIILALVVYYTGSLIASIIVHFIINGSQVMAFYSLSGAYSGEMQAAQESAETRSAIVYIPTIVIFLVIFGGLLALMMRGFIRYNKRRNGAAPFLKTEYRFTDIYVLLSIVLLFVYYIIFG